MLSEVARQRKTSTAQILYGIYYIWNLKKKKKKKLISWKQKIEWWFLWAEGRGK